MAINDLFRQIGSKSSDGRVADNVMNIIEFIESPFGLGFSRELTGNMGLFPVQKFILKAFYNIPLDNKTRNVKIPKTWRDAQSADPERYWNFTEVEYMRYLYDEGRCNIKEQDHVRHELVLPIGRRAGKCANLDTTYVLSSEGLLSLREMGPQNQTLQPDTWYEGISHTIAQEGVEKASASDAFYYKGVEKTFKVTSDCGYHIEGTAEHRVKVLDTTGTIQWKFCNEIQVGDHLCIHRKTNLWPTNPVDISQFANSKGYKKDVVFPETLNKEWAQLLGILVGDGTWGSQGRKIEVTIGPYPEFRRHCEDLFSSLLGKWSWTPKKGNPTSTGSLRFFSVGVRHFLHDLGWTMDPETKRVPWVVRRSPKPVVAAFLQGLFETDGSCDSRGKVTFSSAYRELCQDVQLLLLNFGIISKIRSKDISDSTGKLRTYYELGLYGTRSAVIFQNDIGFITERKAAPLRMKLSKSDGILKCRIDSLPFQKKWVRDIIKTVPKNNPLVHGPSENGWNRSHVRAAAGNTCKPSQKDNMTYPRLRDAAIECGGDETLIQQGEDLLVLDYFFDPVVSVEETMSEVGDLSVPDGNHYVAQGMTNHNSTLSSMVAAYEVYRLLRKGNPQRYYGIQDGADISISTIATTKDQSQILYNGVRNHFQNCEFFRTYLSHDTQSYVKFQTPYDLDNTGKVEQGGRASIQIKFFSSVSAGIRGLANFVIILDEVAFFKETGNSSADAVYQAASPSVATFAPADTNGGQTLHRHSEGRIILISSPFNKDGLFYNKYEQSKGGGDGAKDILMIQAPTWEVNPQVPIGFLENAHGKNAVTFATEFGAEFTDRVLAWIERSKDLMACVDAELRPAMRGKPREPHSLGLDLAVKGDRTSIALTRSDGDLIRLVYHEEWQAGCSWYDLNPHLTEPMVPYAKEIHNTDMLDFDEIAEWIKALSLKFYMVDGLFDQWQGISFKQTIDKLGLTQIESKQFTRDETSQMFDTFKTLMYAGRLHLYNHIVRDVLDEDEESDLINSSLDEGLILKPAPYIKELLKLRVEKKSKKVMMVSAPPGPNNHDDFADALIRSVWLTMHRTAGLNYISGSRRLRDVATGIQENQIRTLSAREYRRRKSRTNNYVNKRGGR